MITLISIYSLKIIVCKTLYFFSDGLDATTMVKVNIRDVNDNAPVFKQMAYSLNLVRDTEPHTVIVNVEAVDKDSSNYGRVTYQIISGNNEALFTVGASSGEI